MLNRKFADLRHAPELDPRVLRYDPTAWPQAIVRLGPGSTRKTKGGLLIGAPGFTWALFFLPGRWYTVTSIYDAAGRLVVHHSDVGTPPEAQDGVLAFLDLKLDLLILPDGGAHWLDREEYEAEVAAGAVPAAWQVAVAAAVAELDRDRLAGRFPPAAVAAFRPEA